MVLVLFSTVQSQAIVCGDGFPQIFMRLNSPNGILKFAFVEVFVYKYCKVFIIAFKEYITNI